MTENKKDRSPVQELVRDLVEVGAGKFQSIDGFLAQAPDGRVRVYSDLSVSNYVELAKSDIIRIVDPAASARGASMVYFRSDAEILYVRTATMRADQVIAAAMAASTSSKPSCGCAGSESAPGSIARQQGGGGGTITLDLCPICDLSFGLCKALNSGWSSWWCYLEYAICRLRCLEGPVVAR